MNIDILRKVQEKILAEPTALDMDDFVYPFTRTPCGTVACIAGWVCALSDAHPIHQDEFYDNVAERLIASPMPRQGSDFTNCDRLFYVGGWPDDFIRSLAVCRQGTSEYAAVVAKRIDRFIETEGKE